MSGFPAFLALAHFDSLEYLRLSAPLRCAVLGYFGHIDVRSQFFCALLSFLSRSRVLVANDLWWLFFAFTDICHKFQPLKNYAYADVSKIMIAYTIPTDQCEVFVLKTLQILASLTAFVAPYVMALPSLAFEPPKETYIAKYAEKGKTTITLKEFKSEPSSQDFKFEIPSNYQTVSMLEDTKKKTGEQ